MMTTRRAFFAALLLIAAVLGATAWIYPSLPDRIPTHWNMHGETDHWSSKPAGPFHMPVMMLLIMVCLLVLPWLSPARFKINPFRGTFNYLMVIVIGYLGYTQALILLAAKNPGNSYARWSVAGLFIFLALAGNVLGRVRRNFWIGIRTPWTLASDAVWIATHRLAARLFVAAGCIGALATALGAPPIAGFVLIIAAALAPAVYSLVLSKRLENRSLIDEGPAPAER